MSEQQPSSGESGDEQEPDVAQQAEEEFEDDPSREPEDERLKDLKGG